MCGKRSTKEYITAETWGIDRGLKNIEVHGFGGPRLKTLQGTSVVRKCWPRSKVNTCTFDMHHTLVAHSMGDLLPPPHHSPH